MSVLACLYGRAVRIAVAGLRDGKNNFKSPPIFDLRSLRHDKNTGVKPTITSASDHGCRGHDVALENQKKRKGRKEGLYKETKNRILFYNLRKSELRKMTPPKSGVENLRRVGIREDGIHSRT